MKCKNSSSTSEVAGGPSVIGTGHSGNMKRPHDGQRPRYSGSLHLSFIISFMTNPRVVDLLLFITKIYLKILSSSVPERVVNIYFSCFYLHEKARVGGHVVICRSCRNCGRRIRES